MSRHAWLLGAALAAALPAQAEERFYPVPGPDGRILMIRGEAKDDKAADSPQVPATAPAASAAATPETAKAGEAGEAGEAGDEPPPVPYAPYDSDTYVDAEALDAATRAGQGKRRFYMIDDGMGATRVSESEGEQLAPPEMPPVLPSMTPEEPFEALPLHGSELDPAAAAARHPGLPACLPKADREQAVAITRALPATLVVTREARQFLPSTGILAAYRLDGEGMRTLVVRSYSRKARRPAFVQPALAFLDARGCLLRVSLDYFERRYGATDARLPLLRADLVVHAEDAYLLVLAAGGEATAADLPVRADLGQLKFTLKD